MEQQRQRRITSPSSSSFSSEAGDVTTVIARNEEGNRGGDHNLKDTNSITSPTKRVTSQVPQIPTTNSKKQFCIENILTDKISSLHRKCPSPNIAPMQRIGSAYRHHEGLRPDSKDYREPIIIFTQFSEEAAVFTPPKSQTVVEK